MSEVAGNDLIDLIENVAPGDIITVDRGSGEQPYRVVFKDSSDVGYVVTLEDDDGETFQVDLAAGAPSRGTWGRNVGICAVSHTAPRESLRELGL